MSIDEALNSKKETEDKSIDNIINGLRFFVALVMTIAMLSASVNTNNPSYSIASFALVYILYQEKRQ